MALGLAGLVAIGLLIHNVGAERVLTALRAGLPWLPLLCILEFGRILSETAASRVAYGALAERLPPMPLLRAHILGHSLAAVAPAPSLVNETIKATLLSRYVGAEAAAAVAVVNQAATLIAGGLVAMPCGLALLVQGGTSFWFWACMAYVAIGLGAGLGLRALTRADAPGRWLAKLIPRLGPRAAAFRERSHETDFWTLGPTAALIAGRAFQTAQLGIAGYAVGINTGLTRALVAEGIGLVAAAAGVVVPAGLGTTDGAYTLAADLFGASGAVAAAMILLMRCTQLLWLLVASMVALFGPRRRA